ncbi:MAG: SRPBCC family protein [Polyangiaceae bacterium]|nr:SRPBCC family protein [Myxococcales bacterium]MCB9586228.1 SRPBCC family protein [Polyangiaceae bacterium]MCB9606905.1 SRPBCC family protein [Polyangiaceae bacterium]
MASANDPQLLERVSDTEIRIMRWFNAPAALVFQAWTEPEYLKRWWAPASRGVKVTLCEADVQVGGKYRYVITRSPEEEYAFSGVYREIDRPSRLVYTQTFEAFPDAAAVCTVEFREEQGRTLMTSTEVYPSKEALEGALCSGMEEGMRETFQQLEALLQR